MAAGGVIVQAIECIWKRWNVRAQRDGAVYDIVGHACLPKHCSMRHLPLLEFDGGHLCSPLAPCGKCVVSKGRMPKDFAAFVCELTGTLHLCGHLCVDSMINTDGARICRFTGLVIQERNVTTGLYGDFVPRVGYVARDVQEYRAETVLERAEDISATFVSRLGCRDTRNKFFSQCVVVVTSVLSPRRFELEQSRRRESNDKIIKAKLVRYLADCNAQRVVPDYLKAMDIVSNERMRNPIPNVFRACGDSVRGIAGAYASRITILWFILRTYAADVGGRELTTSNNFRYFILAVLELFERGLVISDARRQYSVTVICKDPLLSQVQMTVEGHEAVLGTRNNMVKIRKSIKEALQRAVIEKNVSPQHLRVDAYELQHIDDDVFN